MEKIKDFLKKNWLVVILSVALFGMVLAFIIVPLCCGYNLGFINGYTWKADNVITLLGIMVATGTAIYIPWKIADKQNKIALFEKKYKLYIMVFKFLNVHDQLRIVNEKTKNNNSNDRAIKILREFKGSFAVSNPNQSGDYTVSFHLIKEDIQIGEYLFACSTEIKKFVDEVVEYFIDIIINESCNYDELVTIIAKMKGYQETLIPKLSEELELYK